MDRLNERENSGKNSAERTNRDLTEKFQTRRRVRQGCVLSSLLFNLYIANFNSLDRELKNRNIGGVTIDSVRIWNLAYADDIVLLALEK